MAPCVATFFLPIWNIVRQRLRNFMNICKIYNSIQVIGDFKVVPDICTPMVAPGKALDEMILLRDR